jgi:hypothetical protein
VSYTIAGEVFLTKKNIEAKCGTLLRQLPLGVPVTADDLLFLLDVFKHHDEWEEKTKGGVVGVQVGTNQYGTLQFNLITEAGDFVPISFKHAVKCIDTTKVPSTLASRILQFKNAARNEVISDIRLVRDRALKNKLLCPISGVVLTRENGEVDHVAPLTFNQLLFDYCKNNGIKPAAVSLQYQLQYGRVFPLFRDERIAAPWRSYHKQHAALRLLSRDAHRGVNSNNVILPWDTL